MKKFLCIAFLFMCILLQASPAQATALTSGATVNGSLAQYSTGDSYTFSGTAGQAALIFASGDNYSGGNYLVKLNVYKPDGTLLGAPDDRYSFSLPVTGTYTVNVVQHYPTTQWGNYTLNYVRGADSVSSGSLTSGAVASGSMARNGIRSYQFTGTINQGVLLYTNASYGGTYGNMIYVYKPDGSLWTYNQDRVPGNVTNTFLPATGTYTVAVTGYEISYTGTYDLSYLRGSDSVSDGSLTSGQSVTGTMTANAIHSYQFTGTVNQSVFLYASASYGGTYSNAIVVYKPDGTYWSVANDRFSGTLPATGTYTVAVVGYLKTYTGSYSLAYYRGGGSISGGSMTSGLSVFGTLPVNGIQTYQFTGTSGQAMAVYGRASYGGTYANAIYIYKQDGTYWTWGYDRVGGTLPETGTYTVVMVGYDKSYSGSYSLAYIKGADTVSEGVIYSGLQRGNDLITNGIYSYTLSGTASTNLSVTTTSGFYAQITVYNPSGSLLGYDYTNLSVTLPTTGIYTLIITGQAKTFSGAYTVTATYTMPGTTATTAYKSKQEGCPVNLDGIKSSAMSNGGAGGVNGGSPNTGNGMNADLGYQRQQVDDYNSGNLVFARTYRSDSTWTNNTVGNFWRHNYARTLNVSGSNADITDGTGATTYYTLSGGNWVPTDPSTRATLVTSGSNYLYTLPDGTIETYNSTKLLTRIAYRTNGALNLAYNGSNQLTSVTNENGRSLSLTYSGGRVATVVTPDGTFSYSYTSSKLTTVTKPDTKTLQYHYENGSYPDALTGITDEKGTRWATFGYNGSGKVTSTELAGPVADYAVSAYNTNDSTTTNALGKGTTLRFTNIQGVRRVTQVDGAASTNCVASNKYYNYDTLGRMIGKTDWQNVITRYSYDSRSNVTQIIEGYGTAVQRITNITYISAFNLPDVITEPGKTTDYDYDTYGRLVSMTVTDTATSETRVTAYTYYSNGTDGSGNTILGRLHEIDGPRTDVSDVTTFAYDANYDLTTVTNPLSQVTTVVARDSAGRVTRVTDPNSIETRLTYDSNGNLDTATRAYGTALAAVYDFDYDFNENLTKVTLPNSVFVEYSYDNAQRLTGIKDSLNNTVTYTLNDAGNATRVEVKNSTPTQTYVHDQTFDELSRLLTSIGAATPAQTATYAYDKNSNLTTYTDPKTNATSYTYDALQRLATSTNALSGVTTLGYTGLDDVNSVTDQRSHATTYTYNAFGDVTGETSPDRGTLSYTVDKAGNPTQRTDGNSVVTNFTYDALNRVLTVAYPADSSLNATLTYDSSSGCGTPYRGHLCSVVDATGTTTYQYDSLGRVTSASENRGGGLTLATSYTYDLAGNIATITLPSGRVVTYTRNANGQVTTVAAPVNGSSVNLASSVTYLPFGPLKGLTYGNSLTLTATFDTDYNPTNRTISGSIANWTYTTDKNSNVTQAGTTTYGYDALNRINAENSGTATSYTYDATSNRLTKVQGGTTTTTVPSTSNKISAVGGTSYTYDAAGNITAIGTNGYVWSNQGLMKEYKISGVSTATYTYNAYNQRTKKVTGGVTTHYVYGANGLLYGEYTTAGALVREYVYINDVPLAQVTAGSPEAVAYLHTDHLGTPRFATNSGGTQVWAWVNDAFGTSSPSGSVTVNLRMPGQYYDAESGLFYNWNRYYNSAIGRFLSSDLIGIAGGLNTFSYVTQNPVNLVDLAGLQSVMPAPVGPGLPIPIPPLAIPGTPENQQWVKWGQNMANSIAEACSSKDEKKKDRDNYKTICTQGPPPGLDPCQKARWRLNQAIKCYDAYVNFVNKHYAGAYDAGHAQELEEIINRMTNRQTDVENFCKPQMPLPPPPVSTN